MSRKKVRQVDNLKPVLRKALEEYEPNILKDKEDIYKVKELLQTLPEVDRIVFLLYTELQSYTELSKVLNVSRSTCFWMIKRIRGELKVSLSKIS